jgi:hypothetical protein
MALPVVVAALTGVFATVFATVLTDEFLGLVLLLGVAAAA